ncbi:MAG: TspO/MBR family protein [Bacilli bacterium]
MKKKWLKVLFFLFILFLYFLPSFIFKADIDYYNTLKGPHLFPWLFVVIWSIIYITMSVYVTSIVFSNHSINTAEYKRIYVFLGINYLLQATFLPVFFYLHNLFIAFALCIFTFVTILIICLETLLVNKKLTLLTLPYVLWSAFASVFSILFYLQN